MNAYLCLCTKGEDAISKVRRIRSNSEESAKKEIYLWFYPDEIIKETHPTKKVVKNNCEVIEWA